MPDLQELCVCCACVLNQWGLKPGVLFLKRVLDVLYNDSSTLSCLKSKQEFIHKNHCVCVCVCSKSAIARVRVCVMFCPEIEPC